MPASEEVISSCPSAIRRKGAAACATETIAIAGQSPPRPRSAPARRASGTRTAAPKAIRIQAISGADRSRRPISMNR